MPLRPLAIAAALLLSASSAAWAETGCETDLAAVADAIAKKTDLADADRQELQDMQAQAGALCDSGNPEEGKAMLAEAKAILGISQ
jgi:hypothetical protein